MNSQTKKGLITSAIIVVGVFVIYKLLKKPSSSIVTTSTTSGGTTNIILPGTNNMVGSKCYANVNNIYVRSTNDETDYYFYNNIIGVLNAGEEAGSIIGSTSDANGVLWYNVSRNATYNCPLSICGIHISHNYGWVKSTDVNIK